MARLLDSMTRRVEVTLVGPRGDTVRGIVNAIAAEGGAGCFNVTLHTGKTVFMRFED